MNLQYALYVIDSVPAPITELGTAAQLLAAEYRSLVAAIEGLRALEKRI